MKKMSVPTFNAWAVNPLSHTTTKIDLFVGDRPISSGSGFVLKFARSHALVTNWHVLSGLHPTTGHVLHRLGAIPDRIEFHVALSFWDKREGQTPVEMVYYKPMSLNLFDGGEKIWIDDKISAKQNDYACIFLDSRMPELVNENVKLRAITGGRVIAPKSKASVDGKPYELHPNEIEHYYPSVGAEVFVLGYPKGITPAGVFPIWKRASIATEPQAATIVDSVVYSNLFLIDTMTKAGMSGAPVVYIGRKGERLFSANGIADDWDPSMPLLVGVYAGREGVTEDENELSLGRVWKSGAVERMMWKHIAGTGPPVEP